MKLMQGNNMLENINAKPEKRATLVFKRSELLYDVRNYSFVEGDIMEAKDEHARHQVMDVGENGNVDRVTRILNLAHAECVEALYPYTKIEATGDEEDMTDVLEAPEDYRIELKLPDGFSVTTLSLLEHLVHEYMVCRAVGDWMSITNPSSQRNWDEKKEALRLKIQTAIVSRTGKIRRTLKPF